MEDLEKQDENVPSETTRDNFSADEIAKQSAYEDSTQVAQQMRRGDSENKQDADEQDEVGASKLKDWDQRQVQEDKP